MLLGMVSYFAGVVQAPITAFVIVTEMTERSVHNEKFAAAVLPRIPEALRAMPGTDWKSPAARLIEYYTTPLQPSNAPTK